MGVGRKSVSGSYICSRRLYREGISAVDANLDAVTELLDTRIDPDDGNEVHFGDVASLYLALFLGGSVTSVTFQLWMNAEDETPSDIGSSSSADGAAADWVFVEEITVTRNTLWRLAESVPAAVYKVQVTAKTGSGNVAIREQHSS